MVNQSPAMGLLHLEGDVTRDRMRVRGDGTPFDAIVTGLERLSRDDHGLAVAAAATRALIFIGPWLAIPGMPVMTRLAAENCGTSVSENFSSMVAGAETCDLSAGVEDTSEGCANAAVANRPAAIGATSGDET